MATAQFYAFEVKRFRSLVDVKIDICDEMPVVICGENNIGKTNFLRALNIFFNHPFIENLFDPKIDIPHHIYEGSRGAGSKTELIGYFKDDKSNFKLNVIFKDDGDVEYKLRGHDSTLDIVKSLLIEYHFIFIESHNINMPTLISAALEKDGLLPLDAKRAKQSKPLEKLNEFIQLSSDAIASIEKKINESFKKLTDFDGVLNGKTIKINFAEFDKLRDAIKSMTSITLHDGNNHGMASKGSGAQRAVFISLMQYISQNSKRSVIWGIDEPEAFLQPKLQKKVFDVFNQISKDKAQPVIITTHSQHFIKLNELKTTYLFVGESTPREYKRRPGVIYYENNTKPEVFTSNHEKANSIKEHLGISNNDGWAVLPHNLIVEGEQDKKYLEKLFEALKLPIPNIISVGSATKMGGYLQYYNTVANDLGFKPTMVCLFDNDNSGREQSTKLKADQNKKQYKNLNLRIVNLIRADGLVPNPASAKQDWEIEDFIPPEVTFELINKILHKSGYKRLTKSQVSGKNKPAHVDKQVLHYAEECSTQNNIDFEPLKLDETGRKIQLCKLFYDQTDSTYIADMLNDAQKKFLKELLAS